MTGENQSSQSLFASQKQYNEQHVQATMAHGRIGGAQKFHQLRSVDIICSSYYIHSSTISN